MAGSGSLLRCTIWLLLSFCWSATAYWRMPSSPLVVERIDPIISPGTVSMHTHVLHGANALKWRYTKANQATSTCTTVEPQVDLSSYWYPQLYYQWPNKTFSAINTYANFYYLQRNFNASEKLIAFPTGLQMLAGSPFRRTFNSANIADHAISFVCQDYAGGHDGDPAWAQRNDFFSHNCPNSMRAQVLFPPCWDGKNFYKSDGSHMSYPIGDVEHGPCPASHPKRFITLFFEAVFDVQDFPYRANAWTFSFGDQTGLGFHGDFIAQWDEKVLQKAIDTCTDPNSGGGISACPPLVASQNQTRANACRPLYGIVNEDYGYGVPIKTLPGDNPVWTGTGPKPSCGCTVPKPNNISPTSSLHTGYKHVGCVGEAPSGRLLTGASLVDPVNMSGKLCSDFCAAKGFNLAATEWSQECYCGNSFSNGGTGGLIDPWACNMECKGYPTENCGGSRTLSLYKRTTTRRKRRHQADGAHLNTP